MQLDSQRQLQSPSHNLLLTPLLLLLLIPLRFSPLLPSHFLLHLSFSEDDRSFFLLAQVTPEGLGSD